MANGQHAAAGADAKGGHSATAISGATATMTPDDDRGGARARWPRTRGDGCTPPTDSGDWEKDG
jgi:hypothetical protein